MTTDMAQAKIRQERERIEAKIKKFEDQAQAWRQKLNELQTRCTHPNSKWKSGPGYSDNICPDCKNSYGFTDCGK